MGLFKPGWQSADPKKRLKAIDKEKKQAVLLQLALTDAVPEVARAAAGRLTDTDMLKEVALQARCAAAQVQALERVDDPHVLFQAALSRDDAVAAAALPRVRDEAAFVDFAIRHLTPERRMELKIASSVDWCMDRLMGPIRSDEQLMRLVIALVPYRLEDWLMIYLLRAIRKERPHLLPRIVADHPDISYSQQALALIDEEDALAALASSLVGHDLRPAVLRRISDLSPDRPLRKAYCGKEPLVPHWFGEGVQCACCGLVRANAVGIVTDKALTYSFAVFQNVRLQVGANHRLIYRYREFPKDGGVYGTIARQEIQTQRSIQAMTRDLDVERVCASAGNDFFGLITMDHKLKLFPADRVSDAGFYGSFRGNRSMSALTAPVAEWQNVIQMVGDDFLVAALLMDGSVRYILPASNTKLTSSLDLWRDIVQLAMTSFFGGEGIVAGLRWDGRLEVNGPEQARKILQGWRDITFIVGGGHQIVAVDRTGQVHTCIESISQRHSNTYRSYEEGCAGVGIRKVSCAHSIIDDAWFGLDAEGRVMDRNLEIIAEGARELQGTFALMEDGCIVDLKAPKAARYVLEELPVVT